MRENEKLDIEEKRIFENEYLICEEFPELKAGICIAKSEYIPIEIFKESFSTIAELSKEKKWSSFIFDKRALTIFHQPSMEWYYTEWKTKLVESGLTEHYKILPPHSWFERTVEAGKHEIKKNNPDFDFSVFSVRYVKSVDEAIQEIKSE